MGGGGWRGMPALATVVADLHRAMCVRVAAAEHGHPDGAGRPATNGWAEDKQPALGTSGRDEVMLVGVCTRATELAQRLETSGTCLDTAAEAAAFAGFRGAPSCRTAP